MQWNTFIKTARGRKQVMTTALTLLLMFASVFLTLAYVEKRNGYVIETSFGEIYGRPIDFSLPIFALTYFTIAFALTSTARNPVLLLRLLTAYCFMQFLRCISLLIVPLDPSPEILPLTDPILELTFYNGRPNLKDLFFSGHVATIALVAMLSARKQVRILFWLVAATVGIFLVRQRVHYAIDVLAAPLFAWVAVRLGDISSRSVS